MELDQGTDMECPIEPAGISIHTAEMSDMSVHDTTIEHIVSVGISETLTDAEVNEWASAYARWQKIGEKILVAAKDVTQNPRERLLVKNVVEGLLRTFE